jgi:hypothetical protein
MSWESRKGRGRYYTSSIRRQGKVTRLYFGAGPVGELAATQDDQWRIDRQLERLQRQKRETGWGHAEEPFLRLTRLSYLIAQTELLIGGYHKHGGQWRRRRKMAVAEPAGSAVDPPEPSQLEELVRRARRGDESVLPALRVLLDDQPGVWRQAGDLALQARAAWLALLAGPDLLLRERVERKLRELEAELCGAEPTPLERLVVARVLAGWLASECADVAFAQAKLAKASAGLLRDLQRRQDSAQSRYLAAVRMLATVRLLRPKRTAGEPQGRRGRG